MGIRRKHCSADGEILTSNCYEKLFHIFSSAYPPWSYWIWEKAVFIKNRLSKCTSIVDKQQQKKVMFPLWTEHIKQKSSATLAVVDLNNIRAIYIDSSKFSEPRRVVLRLNKVERNYIQEKQPIKFHYYNENEVFSIGWTKTFSRTRLVSEWKNHFGPRLLKWLMSFFKMREFASY